MAVKFKTTTDDNDILLTEYLTANKSSIVPPELKKLADEKPPLKKLGDPAPATYFTTCAQNAVTFDQRGRAVTEAYLAEQRITDEKRAKVLELYDAVYKEKLTQEGKSGAVDAANARVAGDKPKELEADKKSVNAAEQLEGLGVAAPLAAFGELKVATLAKLQDKSAAEVYAKEGKSIIDGYEKAGASQDMIISLTRHLDELYGLNKTKEYIKANRELYTTAIAETLREVRKIKDELASMGRATDKQIEEKERSSMLASQKLERLVGKEEAGRIEKTGIEKALAEKIVQDVLKTGTTVRFGAPLEDR